MPRLPFRFRTPLAFGIAIVAVGMATFLRWAFIPILGDTGLPYIFYFPAVALVGLTGSLSAAVFGALLSALTAHLLFQGQPAGVSERVGLVAFVVTGAAVAALTARLEAALERAAERARTATERGDALEKERSDLADAIQSRAELEEENARLLEDAKRQAQEAERARLQAEEASRVKDEFLATLSHELRTPLNAILGWAHMLRDPRLPEERRLAAVDTIVRNAQSQEQLIADILDVQRIMSGKLRLNLRNTHLTDIIRAAAETVQPSAEAKQIRLQLLSDLDVPPIWGDSDRLQQVTWNLLSNAIKFTPPNGRIQVRLQRSDTHCEMIVEDNGPGIAPEFLPHVFERFRQADSSSTRTHKGLGLGLAIVRSLVEMHGGTIAASNVTEPGRTGAVFTIRLPQTAARIPAAEGIDVDAARSAEVPEWLADCPPLEGIRVLVVDDDADAQELIRTILERCQAEVIKVGSAAEGLKALSTHGADAILADIEMPLEDGYSFIRAVRSMPPESGGTIPAAALTAYASASDRMKALTAGFNMHIAKPVQPAELAMIVASLVGKRAEPRGSIPPAPDRERAADRAH